MFEIAGISLDFTMSYNIYSQPEWIKDSGNAIISIKNLNISTSLVPFNNEGKIQVIIEDIEIDLDDYYVLFNGTSDWSKAMTVFSRSFKLFFKNEVGNIIARRISITMEEALNSMLISFPNVLDVDGLFLNMKLTGNPVFNKDYLTIPFNG